MAELFVTHSLRQPLHSCGIMVYDIRKRKGSDVEDGITFSCVISLSEQSAQQTVKRDSAGSRNGTRR